MKPLMKALPFSSFLLTAALLVAVPQAFAQSQKNDMIDISAEESVEWHQEQQLYLAKGKAKAIKGDLVVEADLLSAYQRQSKEGEKTKKGQADLDRLTAEGNVYIHDKTQEVFGDKATYDMDEGVIKITGDNLKYVTKANIVTAKESLEYYDKKKMAVARGKAIAEHEGTRIQGDLITAHFKDSATGEVELKDLRAKNNVIIVTKGGEVSRGQLAVYDAKKDIAILSGNVRITRGKTQLTGDKASVDFASGKSKLLNKGTGRVRVLLPTSGAKAPEDKKTQP